MEKKELPIQNALNISWAKKQLENLKRFFSAGTRFIAKPFRWLKNTFSGTPEKEPINIENGRDTPSGTTFLFEIKRSYDDLFEIEPLQLPERMEDAYQNIQKYVHQKEQKFREIGVSDGKLNVHNDVIEEFAEVHAFHLVEQVETVLNCLKIPLSSEKDANLINLDYLKARKDVLTESQKELDQEYAHNPKTFSKVQAILYRFLGFFLIVADIPLSFKLAGYFGLGNVNADLNKDGIIKYFFLENFGVLILSLGLACIPFYIKVLFDDYINVKFGMIAQEKLGIVGDKKWQDNEKMVNELKKEYKRKLAVKLLFLCIILITVLFLGFFRHFSYLRSKGMTPEWPSPFSADGIGLITFVLITLLFPILGGVFLSYGIFYANRIKHKDGVKKELQVLVDSEKEKQHEVSAIIAKIKILDNQLTNWEQSDLHDKKDIVKKHQELFVKMYEAGFYLGVNSMAISAFQKAAKARQRERAKKIETNRKIK